MCIGRKFWYFCTNKASKLEYLELSSRQHLVGLHTYALLPVYMCTFLPVKEVK